MEKIPSNQKILFIAEEQDKFGAMMLREEPVNVTEKPSLIILDQKYLENSHVDKTGVIYTSYNDLRTHLQSKRYKKIIFYSLSPRIFQIIDGSDTSTTDIIFRSNPSFLYRNYDQLNRPYFNREVSPTNEDLAIFNGNDRTVKLYNDAPNIHWLFSSIFEKTEMETMLNIKFKNSDIAYPVISNLKKPLLKSSQISIAKNLSNTHSNAIDVDIKALEALSQEPFLKDVSITVQGHGLAHDRDILLKPLESLQNVKVNNDFVDIESFKKIASSSDILLNADRFYFNNIQSMIAANEGCIPVTSSANVLSEISPKVASLINNPEDFNGVAKCTEAILSGSLDLNALRKQLKYDIEHAIKKSKNTYQSVLKANNADQTYPYKKKVKKPVLSVIVPSYNVEPFLRNTALSLVNHPLAHKVEVIIVSDGSKDNTVKIGRELEKITATENGSIITLIDKENGGHGSTINAGIAAANGTYFRLLDGDDYVLTDNFVKLIEILEQEDSDIVLTDLVEDYGISAEMIFKDYYKSLVPGEQRNLDFMHYNGYGFGEWGPLLSTTNVKTSILKQANFLIDENCFYVDMEYNFIIYSLSQTVTYYPLTIYSYYLGRVGQSMSKESLKRNVLHHEKVTLRLLDEYTKRKESLSIGKREYLENKMIIPMCKSQYYIATEMFNTGENFLSFDTKLKAFPDFYNNRDVAGKIVRLHRKMRGNTVRIDKHIKSLKTKMKKG